VAQAYFVECYWPGVSESDVTTAVGRLPNDDSVSLVGSILVPADEILLCVFEGPSAEAVRASAHSCGLPAERIVDCVQLPARGTASHPTGEGGKR
jgi:hypothetical protein